MTFSTLNSPQAGSFAVVDEAARVNSPGAAFTIGATAGAPQQQWSNFDLVQFEAGGGTISNIPTVPSLTITETQTQYGNTNRNVMAAAFFTAAPNVSGSYAWTGGNNGNWDLSTTGNWSGSGTVYADSSSVTFSDGASNPNPITIASGGVQPATVTFSNTATSYLFQNGPIAGPAFVTLNGPGMATFNNNNTYTGNTTINAGTLVASSNLPLGSGLLSMAGGTANFTGTAPSIGGLSGASPIVLGNTINGATSLTIGSVPYNTTYSGAISQVGSGASSLTMAGTNSR